jgi:hypothetical protein
LVWCVTLLFQRSLENGFRDLTGIVLEEDSGDACLDLIVFDRVPDQDIGADADHL